MCNSDGEEKLAGVYKDFSELENSSDAYVAKCEISKTNYSALNFQLKLIHPARVMTHLHSEMTNKTLNHSMRISIEGPPLQEFDFDVRSSEKLGKPQAKSHYH